MGGLSGRDRFVLLVVLVFVGIGVLEVLAARARPTGKPFDRVEQVMLVAAPPGVGLADVDGVPAMVAAANVDAPGRTPRSVWVTVGAGAALDGRGPSRPGQGRLGDAIHGAGLRTALVAPTNEPLSRLALADGQGRVDVAAVAEGPAGLADQAGLLLRSGISLLLVDAGSLDERGFDDLLVRLRAERVPTLVVSPGDSAGPMRLAPLLVTTADGRRDGLLSPSTRLVGLVVLADVAPTILEMLGVAVPEQMTGRPLRRASAGPSVAELVRADGRGQLRGVWDLSMAVIGLALIGVSLWAWRLPTAAPRWRAGLCLLVAGWPLATWLARAMPGSVAASRWAVVIAVAFDLVVVAVSWLACRGRPGAALAVVLGATLGLVTIDLAFGGPLQISSAFGSDAQSAGRFYGLGNGAFAAYAGATAILVASARRRAPWIPALLLLVTLVVALPGLGNDVGGALTLVPVFGLALAALWGRLSWRVVLPLAAATTVLLGAALAIDLSQPEADRSHLARFVTGSGQSATLSRRVTTNVDQYTAQPGLLLVVLLAVAMVVLLARGRFQAQLPLGSTERIGVLSALGVALLGNALNDSGAVVTAVSALFVVPYLVLRSGSRLPSPEPASG